MNNINMMEIMIYSLLNVLFQVMKAWGNFFVFLVFIRRRKFFRFRVGKPCCQPDVNLARLRGREQPCLHRHRSRSLQKPNSNLLSQHSSSSNYTDTSTITLSINGSSTAALRGISTSNVALNVRRSPNRPPPK